MTMMDGKTYVYDGVEVKKTGRTAVKSVPTPTRTRELVLYEVTPTEDFDWKKWVPQEQLYEIRGLKNENS